MGVKRASARLFHALKIGSQQLFELLRAIARALGNLAHRESVDRIMARYGQRTRAVAHDRVSALADDFKPGLA